jgi:tripartite-type tricarboxylate transporter receptor subunit TctC
MSPQRTFGVACSAFALLCGATLPARAADSYPSRPVRFIVPYPPGGTTDLIARGIAEKLGSAWGQQFVIDNRGGASTMIGAEMMARANPDGYTIGLITQTTMSINPHVVRKLPYDPARDFAPITQVVYFPYVIAAHASVPYADMKGMIAQAKAKPGTLTYGTPGTGSTNHFGGAMLESLAGIKLLHVPFKGSGPATNAVLGGEVNMVITGAATVMPHAKAGRLKVLAFADEQRHPNYPDIPSTGEAGLKGYRAGTWFGIVSSSGTPREIVAALNKRIVQALGDADLRNRLISVGFDIQTQSPEAFGKFMADDRAAIAKVIKSAGLRFD